MARKRIWSVSARVNGKTYVASASTRKEADRLLEKKIERGETVPTAEGSPIVRLARAALLVLLALSFTNGQALADDSLELDLGIGVRQTSGLGFEQRTTGDWSIFARAAKQWDRWGLRGSVSVIDTRKFFLPEGDDYAVAASWLATRDLGDSWWIGAGGRHTSLYTSAWEKVRTGADVALGYRWDQTGFSVTAHLPDEDEVDGATLSWGVRQPSRWFSGYSISTTMVRFTSGGVEYDGYVVGLKLNVLSRRVR